MVKINIMIFSVKWDFDCQFFLTKRLNPALSEFCENNTTEENLPKSVKEER